jgi:hypothetical protein
VFEVLDAALPTLSVLAILLMTAAMLAVVAVTMIAVPRSSAVGGRSHAHAVLLSTLPPSSHPDAAGHARSRAPGRSRAVA